MAASLLSCLVSLGISFLITPTVIYKLGSEAQGFVTMANNFVSYAAIAAMARNSMAGRFITVKIHQNDADEYSFSLVDVNRMQLLSDIDCDTVCRNMCRLCISREVLTYIMTEYASLRGWDVESTVSLALRYSDQFFTHYIYRRAARKEKERHIVSLILFFRLYRSVRKFFSWEPHISRFLLKKEKHIYDTYLCKYDYCELLSADYQ